MGDLQLHLVIISHHYISYHGRSNIILFILQCNSSIVLHHGHLFFMMSGHISYISLFSLLQFKTYEGHLIHHFSLLITFSHYTTSSSSSNRLNNMWHTARSIVRSAWSQATGFYLHGTVSSRYSSASDL